MHVYTMSQQYTNWVADRMPRCTCGAGRSLLALPLSLSSANNIPNAYYHSRQGPSIRSPWADIHHGRVRWTVLWVRYDLLTTLPPLYSLICPPNSGIELDEDVCIFWLCQIPTIFWETLVKLLPRLLLQNDQLWMENWSSPNWRSRFQQTGCPLCQLVWIAADMFQIWHVMSWRNLTYA